MMIPTFMTLVLYIFWHISNNFLMRKHFLCRWRSFVGENQLAKYIQHLPCLGSVENLVLVFHQVKYSKWHQLKHLYQHQTVDIKSNIFFFPVTGGSIHQSTWACPSGIKIFDPGILRDMVLPNPGIPGFFGTGFTIIKSEKDLWQVWQFLAKERSKGSGT